jgi:hypothetical protein
LANSNIPWCGRKASLGIAAVKGAIVEEIWWPASWLLKRTDVAFLTRVDPSHFVGQRPLPVTFGDVQLRNIHCQSAQNWYCQRHKQEWEEQFILLNKHSRIVLVEESCSSSVRRIHFSLPLVG